jgi:hypothetical protein
LANSPIKYKCTSSCPASLTGSREIILKSIIFFVAHDTLSTESLLHGRMHWHC